MAATLSMCGAGDHNRHQIQDTLSRLRSQMSMGGSADGITATVRTTKRSSPIHCGLRQTFYGRRLTRKPS